MLVYKQSVLDQKLAVVWMTVLRTVVIDPCRLAHLEVMVVGKQLFLAPDDDYKIDRPRRAKMQTP